MNSMSTEIIWRWTMVTSLLAVPNSGTSDPYLPKMERDTKNIRQRVTQARKIIGALKGVWWAKDITKNRKTFPCALKCLFGN
jgi:hypothetical protein